ncbi:MAG: hypothetical protein DHS20C20_20640 [Ardenticatenaceae bacterium]|nr:MAG: hypothetical protein DHS20C20_20640 [Ardenticatenaceae bacterium]
MTQFYLFMSEQASQEIEQATTTSRWWWVLAGLALLLLVWLVLMFSGSRPLKSWGNTAVSPNSTLNSQALAVEFDTLNDNPSDYVNQRIRVSGNYLRLEPVNCAQFSGPRIEWGLVAAGLQLNATGFETIVLPLVPPNTPMTVIGIWRRYPGPAGCGKEPDRGLWYLEVEQIIEPNPLVASTTIPGGDLSITPPPFAETGTPTPTLNGIQPPAFGTPVPNVTIVSTVVVSTPIGSTPTPGFGTPTAVSNPPTFTPTALNTPTASTTPGPGTPTAVPGTQTTTPTPTATRTPGSGPSDPTPTNPALITATPGSGYPGPTEPPPSATNTPSSYP